MTHRPQKVNSWHLIEERPAGQGLQSAVVQNGHRIVVGDRVGVNRGGWRDKVGMYLGKDYRTGKLKVRFEEFGGALLLCYASELRRMDIVGNEKPVTVDE
jgi:hypothetical protein